MDAKLINYIIIHNTMCR